MTRLEKLASLLDAHTFVIIRHHPGSLAAVLFDGGVEEYPSLLVMILYARFLVLR